MNDQGELEDIENQPQRELALSGWAAFGAMLAVAVSSVIAFCATCLPIGAVGVDIGWQLTKTRVPVWKAIVGNSIFFLAWVIGGLAAFYVGRAMTRLIEKRQRNK